MLTRNSIHTILLVIISFSFPRFGFAQEHSKNVSYSPIDSLAGDRERAQLGSQLSAEAYDDLENGFVQRAIEKFKVAWRLNGEPELLYVLATTLYNENKYNEARRYYEQYLENPSEINEQRFNDIQEKLSNLKSSIASIEVQTTPTEAQIYFDEEYIGLSPLQGPFVTTVGSRHTVEVRRRGYLTENKRLHIDDDRTIHLNFELQPNGRGRWSSLEIALLSMSSLSALLSASFAVSSGVFLERKNRVYKLDMTPSFYENYNDWRYTVYGMAGAMAVALTTTVTLAIVYALRERKNKR